ncbi:glutamine--fructose-6-phosphate transaminase [Frankineae bacterium MT45]|nr:glutamine--fructose-6-phosphate transaminase [Frankineae bacterium MT45]
MSDALNSAVETDERAAGALMAAEIGEQPAVLQRLLADGAGEIAEVAGEIRRAAPRFVIFAARGTSDHAALYAKYLTEIRLGLPAGLASPSSTTVYGSRPDLSDVLYVAVSQSGGSPDLVDSVTAARDCGALTVAVTNNPSSPLAAAARRHVDVQAGAELAVAATKTYTAELLALFLLLGGPNAAAEAAGLADAAAETLADPAAVEAAPRYRYADRLVTTARGYSYPSAREAALKLMETSYLSAQAFSGADLLHGPLAMLDAGVPVIAVVSPGRGGAAMAPVIERLRGSGSDILQVGNSDGLPIASAGLTEELLPILEILPLQRLAWRLALDRGENPDRPRGLAKVTRTW